MPTYEYRCNACENKWEEFQPITAAATKKCPACKKNKAERIISAGGGIIFKGSGFYQTDYRSDSYKKGAKAEKSASENPKSDSAKPDSSSSSSAKADSGSSSKSSDS